MVRQGLIILLGILLLSFTPNSKQSFNDLPFSTSMNWIENNASINKIHKHLPKDFNLIESVPNPHFEKKYLDTVYKINFKYEVGELIGVKFNCANKNLENLKSELENHLDFKLFLDPVIELTRMNGDLDILIYKREAKDYTAVIFNGKNLKITTCMLLRGDRNGFIKW